MSTQKSLEELETLLKKLNSTRTGRRAFLASLPMMLAACGAPSRHRYREGDNTGQETRLTVEDEKRMTAEVLPQMQKDYPPLRDEAMQKYIEELGQEVVHKNGLHNKPYTYNFTVVGVPYVNAFALPAGTVFVTAPLIAMAETEAELAGVVGHEVGHIEARHTAERIDRAERERGRTILSGVGGGILGGATGFGLGSLLCPPRDRECIAKATAAGAAVGAGAGLLIRRYAFMANSREDEMEADRISFRTATRAGYSKDHVGDFYEKLLKLEEQSKRSRVPVLSSLEDAMSTHPPSRERVRQIQKMKEESAATNGMVSSPRFENIRDRSSQWTKANQKKR